jgi:hypothetical protein
MDYKNKYLKYKKKYLELKQHNNSIKNKLQSGAGLFPQPQKSDKKRWSETKKPVGQHDNSNNIPTTIDYSLLGGGVIISLIIPIIIYIYYI